MWIGAGVLAFIAGLINVVGLLGFEHETVTHLTGNTSRLAEAIANLNIGAIHHLFCLIGAFVAGTVISGFVIKDSALQLDHNYSVVLMLESLFLFVSVPLMRHSYAFGMYTAACACGLQNAMMTTYSGAVVRTTHVSGMFTDLGISLGHLMRGLPINRRRLALCLVVIAGFLAGGIFGTLIFHKYDYGALYFPAVLTIVISLTYQLYRRRQSAA